MLTNEHLNKSKELSRSATDFLLEKNIKQLLNTFGKVVYTGSYAVDLMVWPDIDIQLVLPDTISKPETILKLCATFLKDPDLIDVKLINSYANHKVGTPLGMYMGLKIRSNVQDRIWKVDIWALETAHFLRNVQLHHEILSKLTPESRSLLLYWKYKLMGSGDRVPKMGSYYLYQAILFNNLTKDEDIVKFLETSGVKFTL